MLAGMVFRRTTLDRLPTSLLHHSMPEGTIVGPLWLWLSQAMLILKEIQR